ncbi:MAG: DUF4440 domain-containing protein [Planctomycetes bacterium]|nr:DUF4440 domain-containing protein [Planctomycetota bacterium]
MNHGPRLVPIAVALYACCGCVMQTGWTPEGYEGRRYADIPGILQRQAAQWNAGDIDGFMEPYWRSPDLTFSSGGRVVRGWEATRERYRLRYPDRSAMGRLGFDQLQIIPLGSDAALVLGRWRLERDQPVGGAFTLVWRRIQGRWVIVHDHTSVDAS